MDKFNVIVENDNYSSFKVDHQSYASTIYEVEADASGASYFEALAAISWSTININIWNSSKQWDYRFVDVMERLWAQVDRSSNSTSLVWWQALKSIGEIDMNNMPDVAMTLAVIAPLLPWTTRIVNVANMRVKETDRIKAIVTELTKLWVKAKELEDWIEVEYCSKFKSWVQIDTYDDHRMAMCFAILGLAIWDIEILDPGCCSKTYPDFFEQIEEISSLQNNK